MKIKINVRGSAICYLKDNFWHIIFITDDTHLVKFSYTGTTSGSLNLRKSKLDRSITLFPDSPVPPKPKRGKDFDKILNMATEMHGNERLKVKRTFERKREIISMAIPAGILDCDTLTDLEYYIEQTKPHPNTRRPLERKVAKIVKIEMKLNEGKGLSILIQDSEGSNVLPFPFKTGSNLELTFDNDCGAVCKEVNDFDLYYDWVKDKDEVTRYIAGKLSMIKSEQGNCDPVSIDPPPTTDPPEEP
jgi:hypothetical protein